MSASRMEFVSRATRRNLARLGRGRRRSTPAVAARGAPSEPLAAGWRIWGPLALRALALAVALLGLAGIGSVAGRAPRPPALVAAQAGLDLGSLSVQALASAGSADAASTPAAPSSAPPASTETAASGASAVSGVPAASGASDVLAASGAVGSPCPTLPRATAEPAGHPSKGSVGAAPVVLNRADAAELQRLPGVGPKRAEAILALRERLGQFRRISDLLRVKGIGPRMLERMRPHLVLD